MSFADFPEDPERGSFLIIHADEERVEARVDRFSTIPFYYCVHEGNLYGGTTLDRLLQDAPAAFPRRLDETAAVQFVRTNSMIGDRTLLAGVARLAPASCLRFDRRSATLSIEPYWRLPGDVREGMDYGGAARELHAAFLEAMRGAAEGAARVGLHLSGGMDSRQALGAALELGLRVKAYTYGVEQNLDVVVARRLAETLGVGHVYHRWNGVRGFRENFELQLELTDGMQGLIHGHGIDLHRQQAAEVDRLIIGHFLDLFIQGHKYDADFAREGRTVAEKLYRLFDGGACSIVAGDRLEPWMLERGHHGRFRESIQAEIAKLDYMIPEKRYDALYLIHHGLRRLLPQCQAAARFLDCRTPGLDRDYFAAAWSMPGRLRRGRRLQEELLRRHFPRMVESTPIVMDNCRLRYIGPGRGRRWLSSAESFLRCPGVKILRPYYDYYGREISRMANEELFQWMKEEILGSPLPDLGVFRREFLADLFQEDRMRKGIGLSLYGALTTVAGFVKRHGVNG